MINIDAISTELRCLSKYELCSTILATIIEHLQ
jgi:hypothetical protein